jgi:HKD family nuclease
MSRLNKIKEEKPDLLEDNDFEELLRSADTIHDISVAAESNGGKALIKYLLTNVVNTVHLLSSQHQTMTQTELTSTLSKMSTNLATARFLTTAKGDVEELDKQIQEMLHG